MKKEYRELIANEFRACVNGTINRISQNKQTFRPFHAALLSEEAVFWSAFERSFSTSFGERVIEEIAKLAALSNGADKAKRQKKTTIHIDEAYDKTIHDHIQALRSKHKHVPSWQDTLDQILTTPASGRIKDIRIISDLWWEKGGVDNFISLKTVKPNIDQTAVAKEDCLHLSVAFPNCNAYFGLPYNPYGEDRRDYNFTPPMGIFDFRNDPVVLIGRDLWDTIGGEGCYDELLAIATQVGEETKEAIRKMRNR